MTPDATGTLHTDHWRGIDANRWMVEEIETTQGVRHAFVFTADGFVTAVSSALDRDGAEKLAAACSAMASLGRAVAGDHGEGGIPSHVVYELNGAKLMFRGAGDRTYLGVITEAVIDPALVAHQMTTTVRKIGERSLSSAERPH
ncbi:dynein regulation protein LC7 [Frankia sp. CcI49]|uniref:roadblock/LC7 domain-containing protein n=1 Tax=Frankia sp. CcI49 TaxID=1745382 RepID=UPI000977D0F6|nr:roadblock/LC7 domain-containing protein [Frankia sp. CcI49]ONH56293.1 dynein regulation protein LC7 [Frankia sp. CcI49]